MEETPMGESIKISPISKGYVQALEGQVASLELLIRKLAVADSTERDDILSELALSPPASLDLSHKSPAEQQKTNTDPKVVAAQVRSGQLRRPRSSHATQFFGGTSAFHIHLSQDVSMAPGDGSPHAESHSAPPMMGTMTDNSVSSSPRDPSFVYAPHDETSQACMAAYFKYQYQFHMLVYREYFLRDYDVGSGRYYSDALLFAICSLGAMQLDDSRPVSDIFANQAQQLIYSTLDSPELTTLQALALLGYREIGVGHTSKGWLFAGMAFRLAHEMGLHLDPNNWDASTEGGSNRDTEILRRVYWAIFIADKQLSLYFGRPPALHPSESDVRNTIRLQYPPDWEGLLDTYICKGASATEFEDGVALVGSFIYQAELCKIAHVMITDLFENRRGNVDATVAAARSRQIHVSLTKWLSSLPGTLHWNQWTVGVVQPSVLRMHMLFHTIMIILHRPPSHMYEKQGIAESEDVEICYESLQAILRLMRTYSRHYRFRSLPLDFVQTLSTAAGTIMMKRFFQGASWDDSDIARSLSTVIDAMEEVQHTWPCMGEIKDYVVRARNAQVVIPPEDPLNVPDLMNGLELSHNVTAELMAQWGEELGTLVTDEFLSMQLQGSEQGIMAPFDFNQPPLGPQ
ncbi:CHA4-transcription factor [Fusarium albosuccineum]|uniref:CHA4-transcription factor n=1 Tax=Fusarium albosuccineum TaxID=1237068 RepID=A0A8H4L2N4_9HYPO|nr:CHA4-transcription factor [Fusarium albosuccineum]